MWRTSGGPVCLSGPTMVRIWAKLKLVKFYGNFSQYSFELLIGTLHLWKKNKNNLYESSEKGINKHS